jgi:transposase
LIEYNYIRHGTLSLIGNFEVATGKILSPFINETRTEEDFAKNIENLVNLYPDAELIFLADQLNTHKSESLVKLIAEKCKIDIFLGKKGRKGILKSMETRQEFLEDASHRIRFVFLPKHTSWLNQIEIWFSILARKIIRRGNFKSTNELKDRILKFIDFFNVTAKPFKWTYAGKVLQQ